MTVSIFMQTDSSSANSPSSRKWVLIPLGAAILMFVGLAVTGRFQYRLEPDSQDYIDYSFKTLAEALSGIRTPGYPLFVAIAKSTFGIAAIPVLHWALYSAAVMFLFFGLVRVGVRASVSSVCCAAMMFSRSLTDLGPAVLSDSLAISLAVAAVATALFCVSPGADWKHWFLLSVLVTADYLVRPALLFMLLLVPLLVAWFDFWILRRSDVWYKRFQRALLCLIATILPFVSYCGLRFVVVGEFGFVSFAGYNIIGIAGQAIDEDVIDRMPAESQQLARLIAERKNQLPTYRSPVDYESMEEMFNLVVWQVAVPTAKELFGENPKVINIKLRKLSQHVLRLRPGFYRQWLWWNGKHAIRNMLELVLRDVGTLLAIALALGGVAFNLVADKRCSAGHLGCSLNCRQLNFELQIVFWIAISYSTACTLLVMLVEPTLARYLTSAIPFWPAFIALLAAHLCERLLSHKCRST